MSDTSLQGVSESKPKYEGWLFLAIVCIELAGLIVLSILRIVPVQWDTLQYLQLQYYFLNSAVTGHVVPQWIPYLTHGTLGYWLYEGQAGILQSGLIEIAPLVRHVNLLYCFNAGVFFDKLILLTGVWLYCRWMAISVPGTFVAAICCVGPVIWMDQIAWNLHLYYAIPLILYFGHRFLESGLLRYFVLAGNLLAQQMWGNVPYAIPVVTFFLAIYFLANILINWTQFTELAHKIHWRWLAPACAVAATGLWASYYFMTIGVDQIADYSDGRNPDGTTSIDMFLKYGGNLGPFKWADLLAGISPSPDFTLYLGMLGAALMAVGVIGVWMRRRGAIVVAIAFLLLFSSGTWVSVAGYFFWPGMHYFRHLTLISTLVKMFLCILSGIGFDVLFDYAGKRISQAAIVVIGVALLVWSVRLMVFASHPYLFNAEFVIHLVEPPISPDLQITHEWAVHALGIRTAIYGLIAGALILLVATQRRRRLAQWLVILCLLADVYQYQWMQQVIRGTRLSPGQLSVMMPQPPTFAERRSPHLFNASERARAYWPTEPVLPSYYWTADAFVFVDEAGARFRTDYWLRPFDRLLKAFQGQDIDATFTRWKGKAQYKGIDFPVRPIMRKIAGITSPKIQFFTHAYSVPTHNEMGELLTNPHFAGNLLFVDPNAAVANWKSGDALDADEKLSLKYTVTNFDSNDLDIDVSNDSGGACWMMYCDAWNPAWSATVNGHQTPVLCADLAYKAVPLEKGINHVHFNFNSTPANIIMHCQRLNAVFWIGMIVWLAWRICRGRLLCEYAS